MLILLVAGVNIFMENQDIKKLAVAVLVTASTASTMVGKVADAFKFYDMIEQRLNENKTK